MRRAPIMGILIFVIAASIGFSIAAPATLAASCSWSAAGAPNPGRQLTVFYAVDGLADDSWIVGSYKNKGARERPLTLNNTGSGWKVVQNPTVKGRESALAGLEYVGPGDVWAVGLAATANKSKAIAEHWDGTSWTMSSVPASGKAFDVLLSADSTPPGDIPAGPLNPTQLWAVGQSSGENNKGLKALIAHFNGTSWELQPTPAVTGKHGLSAVLVLAADDVWAVGTLIQGKESRPLSMHFDGSSWTNVPVPAAAVGLGGSSLSGIAGVAPNDLWAVGSSGNGIPLVMHWDGSVWSQVVNVADPASQDFLTNVTMDAAGDLWAVGISFKRRGFKTLIQTMSGGSWSTMQSPNPASFNALLDVAAIPGGPVWSVGYKFANPQGQTTPKPTGLVLRCG